MINSSFTSAFLTSQKNMTGVAGFAHVFVITL